MLRHSLRSGLGWINGTALLFQTLTYSSSGFSLFRLFAFDLLLIAFPGYAEFWEFTTGDFNV
jgi:hypothetical protein